MDLNHTLEMRKLHAFVLTLRLLALDNNRTILLMKCSLSALQSFQSRPVHVIADIDNASRGLLLGAGLVCISSPLCIFKT